eukprot:TRINITY_DN68123_c2_g10_i1.p1 TRINITY_DN68123_c2_g10~~TRINITY_DN68123_c2_g10_i1.p1  ORF type:complete len:882 (+),score=65.05 TRINITY_DN68123_c2_g10_i1:71-2647(+)
MSGLTYLDYGGAGVYTDSQLTSVMNTFLETPYGNPHSGNPTSTRTSHVVDAVRNEVLQFFNTTMEEYDVVFTSGCTAGLKTVGELFPWSSKSCFAYTRANHNSVIGIRNYALKNNASILPLSDNLENFSLANATSNSASPDATHTPKTSLPRRTGNTGTWLQRWWSMLLTPLVRLCLAFTMKPKMITPNTAPASPQAQTETNATTTHHLFAMPAMCNFSGKRYNLDSITTIQNRPQSEGQWSVVLDASALVGKYTLDLSANKPDFVTLSFYKMFGYPTGLGALLIRRSTNVLRKVYFGGGTVDSSFVDIPKEKFRSTLHSQLEDGTVSFLDIVSLQHGFKALHRLGGVTTIAEHMSMISHYLVQSLAKLKHFNGVWLVQMYGSHWQNYINAARNAPDTLETVEEEGAAERGCTVSFNLVDPSQKWIGFSQVETLAGLNNILLRTGCFCNPGACQHSLDLSLSELIRNMDAGHVCWDARDVLHGKPTGAVRISLGPYSTKEDVDVLANFLTDFFIVKDEASLSPKKILPLMPPKTNRLRVSSIAIYPVKSCAGIHVKEAKTNEMGLEYDRQWVIIDSSNGNALSQKLAPKLALIKPAILPHLGVLQLTAPEMSEITVPLNPGDSPSTSPHSRSRSPTPGASPRAMADIRVRGRVHKAESVSNEEKSAVATWLTSYLGRAADLVRVSNAGGNKKSFANEGEMLLACESSLEDLQRRVADKYKDGDEAEQHKFNMDHIRPNIVITGGGAWQEDVWKTIQIGDDTFQVTGACGRCTQINTDATGLRSVDGEPLLTLASFRRLTTNGKAMFGMYVSTQADVSVHVGDQVQVIDSSNEPLAFYPPVPQAVTTAQRKARLDQGRT